MDYVLAPNSSVDSFLEKKGIFPLPDHEEKWEIPPPSNWPLRAPSPPPVQAVAPYQDYQGPAEVMEKREQAAGLTSWPPRAPSGYRESGAGGGRISTSKIWPPPQHLGEKDHSDLPPTLRPSKLEPFCPDREFTKHLSLPVLTLKEIQKLAFSN